MFSIENKIETDMKPNTQQFTIYIFSITQGITLPDKHTARYAEHIFEETHCCTELEFKLAQTWYTHL